MFMIGPSPSRMRTLRRTEWDIARGTPSRQTLYNRCSWCGELWAPHGTGGMYWDGVWIPRHWWCTVHAEQYPHWDVVSTLPGSKQFTWQRVIRQAHWFLYRCPIQQVPSRLRGPHGIQLRHASHDRDVQ